VATLLTLFIAYVFNPAPHFIWNYVSISGLLYNALLATSFCYWGIILVSRYISVVTNSVALLGVPVLGLFFSSLILHESITLSLGTALVLIIIGLILVAISDAKGR